MEIINKYVKTEDGKKISLNHYNSGRSKVVIIAHGFYANKDDYNFKRIADIFNKEYDVISFDFRGHGKSSGLFSWASLEEKDLRAVILFAKENRYKKVAVIGFSMGAAVTLIEASKNRDINSVIAVSTPYNFWKINYHFWKKEFLNEIKIELSYKGRGKGIRPGNPFMRKKRPIDIVEHISPTPIFFIHGKNDWLINPYHSKKLFEKSKEPKKITILNNAGHAERIFDFFPSKFENICTEWLRETL